MALSYRGSSASSSSLLPVCGLRVWAAKRVDYRLHLRPPGTPQPAIRVPGSTEGWHAGYRRASSTGLTSGLRADGPLTGGRTDAVTLS